MIIVKMKRTRPIITDGNGVTDPKREGLFKAVIVVLFFLGISDHVRADWISKSYKSEELGFATVTWVTDYQKGGEWRLGFMDSDKFPLLTSKTWMISYHPTSSKHICAMNSDLYSMLDGEFAQLPLLFATNHGIEGNFTIENRPYWEGRMTFGESMRVRVVDGCGDEFDAEFDISWTPFK